MFSVIKRRKEVTDSYSRNKFLADYRTDVTKLPTNSARGTQENPYSAVNNKCAVGSICKVCEDGSLWILNNQNEWIESANSGSGEEDDEFTEITADEIDEMWGE